MPEPQESSTASETQLVPTKRVSLDVETVEVVKSSKQTTSPHVHSYPLWTVLDLRLLGNALERERGWRESEKIKRERIKSETERLLGCTVRHSIIIECLSQVFPNACCFNYSFGRT